MNQVQILAILKGDDASPTAHAMRAMLAAAAPFYRLAMGLRNASFDRGLRKIHHLSRPVISVGNLTTGGTGKTPMVIYLAKQLLNANRHPAILLRGYHQNQAGQSDEAIVLRQALGSAVTVEANPDRVEASKKVLAANPQVDVFLLDDGFQHRRVHREVNLVLVDAVSPFGFDHLLPRGLLREPLAALCRADAVIITRADQIAPQALNALNQTIQQVTGKLPIAHAAHTWASLLDAGANSHAITLLADQKVAGICGLGNPAAFRQSLNQFSKEVTAFYSFDDHYHYKAAELHELIDKAASQGAQAVVTSEKDFVKWPQESWALPVYRVVLEISFLDGQEALLQAISLSTKN